MSYFRATTFSIAISRSMRKMGNAAMISILSAKLTKGNLTLTLRSLLLSRPVILKPWRYSKGLIISNSLKSLCKRNSKMIYSPCHRKYVSHIKYHKFRNIHIGLRFSWDKPLICEGMFISLPHLLMTTFS